MEKRKIMGIGLSALLFLGTASAFIGLAPQKTAYADEPSEAQTVALSTENAQLFLPDEYEEYLPLVNPTYMAMSTHYIAIADGTDLYIYDRVNLEYQCYSEADLTTGANISKIQISADERLFFSDTTSRLYEFKFEDNSIEYYSEVPCSTFLIEEKYLYAVSSTDDHVSLSRYSLSNLTKSGERPIRTTESSIVSKLSCANGVLYCVRQDTHIVSYDLLSDTPQQMGDLCFLDKKVGQVSDLKRVCVYRNYLYYSVNGTGNYENGLWRTDFNGNAELMIEGDGFSAINTYNGELYCIRGSSVLKLTVDENAEDPNRRVRYADYEIASASSSDNRLNHAVDTVRAGNLLVTADAGNQRVSVFNQKTKSYSTIPCGFTPLYVATDGETIAVAAERAVYTFKYGDKNLGEEPDATTKAPVKGIACVYGNVYYITENFERGKVGESETAVHSYDSKPQRLTRDLYGNLYVSVLDGDVYTFSEKNFLSNDSMGEKSTFPRLPRNHTSLRADFDGNIYCLADNVIYKNGEAFANVDGNEFVYHNDDDPAAAPVSFALGFEDSSVYFNFGNYLVKTDAEALDIPTLDKIVTGEIADEVFSVHAAENLLVDVSAKTVGVKITLSELVDAEGEKVAYFPYESYYRLSEERRGVLIGSTDRYRLVLLPDGWGYTATLFQIDSVSFTEEDYCPEYYEDGNEQRYELNGSYYLSSGVHSYYAPCLDPALQDTDLARGAQVTVIGFLAAPDRAYALVSYGDGSETAREIKTGYVPSSFLSVVSPLPSESAEYLPVYLKANEEGIVFHAEDNAEDTITVTERTEAKAMKNEDGTYTVIIEKDGKTYVAESVKEDQIDWQKSDALRIALIIILSTLALVIIGAYIFLLPRKNCDEKPRKKKKAEKTSAKKE